MMTRQKLKQLLQSMMPGFRGNGTKLKRSHRDEEDDYNNEYHVSKRPHDENAPVPMEF
jgi:hypothetical protein